MRKTLKMLLYTMAALAGLAVIAIGVWVYYVQNVEQPTYAVVEKDGDIEIRDYPPLVVAEVTTRGERGRAVNLGFRPLANYIFAKERPGPAIPMTAPVTQHRASGDAWIVRFIMPSKYKLADLPVPAGSDVRLQDVAAARRAAIRFSGVAKDELIDSKLKRLQSWLSDRKISTVPPVTFAYYNDPFTPGPLRRNEVLVDLAPRP